MNFDLFEMAVQVEARQLERQLPDLLQEMPLESRIPPTVYAARAIGQPNVVSLYIDVTLKAKEGEPKACLSPWPDKQFIRCLSGSAAMDYGEFRDSMPLEVRQAARERLKAAMVEMRPVGLYEEKA